MTELPFPRAFVIWALRQWVWPGPDGYGRQLAAAAFERIGTTQAWTHFEAMVSLWGAASRRPLAIPPPCCPIIDQDEALFADALALVQNGRAHIAAAHWRRDLPEAAVIRLLTLAGRIVTDLAAAGLVLDDPTRDPDQICTVSHRLH